MKGFVLDQESLVRRPDRTPGFSLGRSLRRLLDRTRHSVARLSAGVRLSARSAAAIVLTYGLRAGQGSLTRFNRRLASVGKAAAHPWLNFRPIAPRPRRRRIAAGIGFPGHETVDAVHE